MPHESCISLAIKTAAFRINPRPSTSMSSALSVLRCKQQFARLCFSMAPHLPSGTATNNHSSCCGQEIYHTLPCPSIRNAHSRTKPSSENSSKAVGPPLKTQWLMCAHRWISHLGDAVVAYLSPPFTRRSAVPMLRREVVQRR